jgi:hypothetical protein
VQPVGKGPAQAAAPADTGNSTGADSAGRTGATAAPAAAGSGARGAGIPAYDTAIVRALYVNRWKAQSGQAMRSYVAIADSTEINALVIDVKDEFGLNYQSSDSLVARNAGGREKVRNLKALVDTLLAHDILPIARLVVFKDSVAARANPSHVIRKPDGGAWRDKEGLTWVNPYDRTIWEYNIRVAEEMARLGFREIQFDYIRFPEPYKSLPPQVFPEANGVRKPQNLAEFLKTACDRIHAAGAGCTADIFGLVTTVRGALEVGQEWEVLAPVTDVLLPMVYPSHYPRGSFGVDRPNAEPYKIIFAAIDKARQRNAALGITSGGHVRPWLQAFSLGQPKYDASHITEQKRAVYDAGYDGWVLWSPGSNYGPFLPALERETVSRRKRG